MKESNGCGCVNGDREYQFLSLEEVREYYESYQFEVYMCYAYPLAMDGNGNFFVLNLREREDNVYCVSAGDMGWGSDECFAVAQNFRNFCARIEE